MTKRATSKTLPERLKAAASNVRARAVVASATLAVALTPTVALAENLSAQGMVDKMLDLISKGAILIGLVVAGFGGISVGTNVAGATQGNGGAISSGVAMIVGGLVVAAVGALFMQLDTSWLVV